MEMLQTLWNAFSVFFLIFSVIGIISGVIIFFSPGTFSRIEQKFSRPFHVDSRGIFVDAKIDIEYVFFNHHVSTAAWMVVLSSILLYVNHAANVSAMEASRWFIAYTFFKFFFYAVASLGLFYGLFLLISPKNAFLLLRRLNRSVCSISTDYADIFMQKDIIDRKIYLKYPTAVAGIMFVLSLALLYLISRQMFF
jgi:hypothetical protein